MSKYKHEEIVHNLDAPSEIVPIIYELLKPNSVVDFGCGIGTFLKVFKDLGVDDVLGIDGKWVNKKKLYNYIEPNEFLEYNLEKAIVLKKRFDLVLSLEVAEHLSEDSADIFVKNLVDAGEVILFSAAIPMQGGQNHLNEQWLTYWESKFLKYDYVIHDVLRPIFWDHPKVNWWYKQNMVLITPKNYSLKSDLKINPIRKLVHYDLLIKKDKALKDTKRRLAVIKRGEAGRLFYFKLLLKSLFKKPILK
ncbi:bifunctional 2-polyprenyl-6-hydroxyphenol methylase/3-demethylubiquinol 3-O-methyltransferase UbiG [Aequorivita sp. CIP111184]|uniref:class I SAM-dependent methyltransferase n=1 Tax=Aequorivita sp. CIP111184 TaxID=2211356 RepID=UPI000DBBBB7C|nr:methyltransferase domain-containing protein [Aequorivita sp. CIP111184]SRX55334.1 Ubiquinone biosynthesis O-methyltransferase [Aequorivita sp. CIP111184]